MNTFVDTLTPIELARSDTEQMLSSTLQLSCESRSVMAALPAPSPLSAVSTVDVLVVELLDILRD